MKKAWPTEDGHGNVQIEIRRSSPPPISASPRQQERYDRVVAQQMQQQ